MPDWLPSAVIAAVAIVVMVWLVRRVAPGWLPGDTAPALASRRKVSGQRTLMTLIALVLAVLVLVLILYYVFSLPTPA